MACLFLYGTLKAVARQRGGRPAHVWGQMWENGAYPAIRLTRPGDGYLIPGLVFEVTLSDLAEFDRREGVAHVWYRRGRVKTVEGQEVWVYEAARCLSCQDARDPRWQPMLPGTSGVADWGRDRLGEASGRAMRHTALGQTIWSPFPDR